MVKASIRTVHHSFAKFADQAHDGEEIILTKRGKPWARIVPLAVEKRKKPKKLDWNKVFERTEEIFKGRKIEAVKSYLKDRAEARW